MYVYIIMDLEAILRTHPIRNLRAVVRSVKSPVILPKNLTKEKMIQHILKLKKDGYPVPPVEKYEPPPRAKKAEKEEPKRKKIIVKVKKVVPRKTIKKETQSQKRARGIAGPAEAAQEDALNLLEKHRVQLEKIPVMITKDGKRVPDPSGNNFYKNKKEKISSKSFLDGSYKMRIDRAKRELKAIEKQIEKIAAKSKKKTK